MRRSYQCYSTAAGSRSFIIVDPPPPVRHTGGGRGDPLSSFPLLPRLRLRAFSPGMRQTRAMRVSSLLAAVSSQPRSFVTATILLRKNRSGNASSSTRTIMPGVCWRVQRARSSEARLAHTRHIHSPGLHSPPNHSARRHCHRAHALATNSCRRAWLTARYPRLWHTRQPRFD